MKKPKHIFIVEDNEIYSMMLDYILSKDSIYRFVRFKSGEECIQNLYLEPDVIILDYGLPGMDGYQTLIEIKKRNPETRVVVLSNNKDQHVVDGMLTAGADDFIHKQEHGEQQVIRKLDSILSKETNPKWLLLKKGFSFIEKFFYFVLVISLFALGIFIVNDK